MDNSDSNARKTPGRAFSIKHFCRIYDIGRTTAYGEMTAGRLKRRKVGKRTLITQDDAEAWLRALPESIDV
jgi:hypothetical protein